MLSDKEIAEDILSTEKYMSNYFYAPAVLECADDQVRSVFQQVHSDAQAEAKEVFNYLNMRGWYKVNQADNQSLNELRNTAEQSRQMIRSISQPGTGWTGTQAGEGQSGYGPSSLTGTTGQGFVAGQGFVSQPGTGWTGTQAGEGQSGYGPSSLSQAPGQRFSPGYGFADYSGVPQATHLPSWTRGAVSQQPEYGQIQREGQTGMGPSLYAQSGFRSPVGQAFPQQASLPSWTRGPGNMGTGQLSSESAGEGMGGFGPSSLSRGAIGGGEQQSFVGGHESFIGGQQLGYGGQGIGAGGYYGVPQQMNLPSWTRGTGNMGTSQFGGQQPGYGGQGIGIGGYYGVPQQMNLPSWTRGPGNIGAGQYGGSQQEGQPGMGPSLYAQTGISGQSAYQGVPNQVRLPSWTQGAVTEPGFQQGSIPMRRDV